MATIDVYAITNELNDTLLQVLATRLEARGQHPRFQAMLTEYLDAMNIDTARTILDIGCGTGVAARAIARRKGFTGRVTGVDISAGLVQVAERLSTTEGVSEQIQFVVGDTRRLDIPDEAFDAVVAHTTVSHVDDPLLVVKEAARVVRRGGTVLAICARVFSQTDPKSWSEEEAAGWIDGLLEDSRNGVFFGACNYYSYIATRLQSLL
jgi:arsenite methyltransferase